MAELPHLLHFRVSHFNEKVRWALDLKRVPHRRTSLIPGFHLARVRRLTGQNKLPVLIMGDGQVYSDSTTILAELERRHPEPALLPADPALRARALALEDYYDEEVAPALRRLFWSTYLTRPADCARMATDGAGGFKRLVFRVMLPVTRGLFRKNMGMSPGELEAAASKLDGYVSRLEADLGPSGYLVGDSFSVADLTAAAVMTALLRPPEFPYPLPEPWPPALIELRARIAERAGSRWVLDLYRRHRGVSSEVVG